MTTILIVDDNLANLSVLMDTLRDEGHRIIIAQSGESALERLKHITPDLILLDVIMPNGIDGFETLRRLKANENTNQIPVIFLTALGEIVDEVKGLTLGAVDYIVKPIQLEKTLARINIHLRLHQLQQDLQLQNEELDAFAHTVAHDIRSPLAIILGNAEMLVTLRDRLDDTQQEKMAQSIWDKGQTAVNIVDELLLLATVRKQDNIFCHPLNMARTINRAIRRVSTLADTYSAHITQPDTWPIALGYEPWIEEVWVNYLSNGIKYSGTPPCLECGAKLQPNGMVRYWVKDNGIALTAEEQARLFTEFTRLNKIKVSGHGLGLSIVKRIIDRLGGNVGIINTANTGNLFFFELPAQPND